MKIRFVVDIEAGEYPFVIDTDRLPYSIGDKEIALKDFEIIEEDASPQPTFGKVAEQINNKTTGLKKYRYFLMLNLHLFMNKAQKIQHIQF